MEKPSIKLLPEDLINKIAAGEVVERPASVAKELIENAIDAGSTRIVIEIQEAGKKLIRVSDNGCGMSEEEIKLALQRHSTSKIGSLDDLFNIQTLGFRGEALPSIASVSKMKIEKNPSAQGITVEVKDLFYNTPARRKFLKANSTEIGHIGDIISKYAMADPQIAFKFISDGKTLLNSPGTGQLIEALAAVYGPELAQGLIELSSTFAAGKIFGFVSRPNISRIDKNYETFYVNKRYIRNFLLNRALEEAFRTLIPNNRYPVALLFIDIDPHEIDVNVHPTKREIKFLKTQEVMDAVNNAVKTALSKVIEPGIEVGSKAWQAESFDQLPTTNYETGQLTAHLNLSDFPEPPFALQEQEFRISSVQPLIPLFQFKQTYIIATDGEELVLIDQHAAHERILYDQLSRESTGGSNLQSLLIPETIELNLAEAEVLKNNIEYLKSIGFGIEEFGNNSFILRAVPAVAAKAAVKQLLFDLISELQEMEKSVQLEVKKERMRKLVACHSAIKAGDKLNHIEINQLIRDLFAAQNPLTCPHGRPTMVRVTEQELKKRFGR